MASTTSTTTSTSTARLIILGLVVVLEGLALLSVILETSLLPLPGVAYGIIISVAVFVLPIVVGFLSQRIEAAILLAVLPFVVLAIVYLAVYEQPWTEDLFSLGPLAYRTAGALVLLGALGTVGWLLRRVIGTASASQAALRTSK